MGASGSRLIPVARMHDGPEQFGAFTDGLMADAEMLALQYRLQSSDNPVVIEQQTVAVEVPLPRTSKVQKPGPVLEVHVSRVSPVVSSARSPRPPQPATSSTRMALGTRGSARCSTPGRSAARTW